MTGRMISDDLWQMIEPHLPPSQQHAKVGRPTLSDRHALTGIVFILKTRLAWADLPQEMCCGCGTTCVRRLRSWYRDGIWQKIQPILENGLPHGGQMDWARANRDAQLPQVTRKPSGDSQAP